MKNWSWIIFVVILISSCLDNADCVRSGEPALVVSFKDLTTGAADSIIFYNITAEGADSIFYKDVDVDKKDTLSTVIVAVNPFENETLFTFFFESAQKTLRVGYKNEVRFVSEECGSERIQYSLKILETQFDSARVVNNILSKKRPGSDRPTNIEIYN